MFSKPGQIDSRFFVVRTTINSCKKRMIGTSGFIGSKREWVNAASFPEHGPTCLEVNSSFYRVPSPKIIDSLRALPSNPKFVFKVHKRITHQKRLSDAQRQLKNPLFSYKVEKMTVMYITNYSMISDPSVCNSC